MNTTFDLKIATTSAHVLRAETTLEECHQLITDCEAELSEFLPTSPVYLLNRAPVGEAIPLGHLGSELLYHAENLRIQTRDAFHYGAKGERAPNPPFHWNTARRTIARLHEKAWLGFGAIGKGFALDKIRERIERAGFQNYCLSAGGSSIILSGLSGPDSPWKWAWSWKKSEAGQPLGLEMSHDLGTPIAIGVSGIEEQGQHLLAPTGRPSTARVRSALIAGTSATEADALSTALFVSGWDKFAECEVAAQKELSVAIIDDEEVAHWNGGFEKVWGTLFGFWAFLTSSFCFGEEEAIDLGELGVEQFNPYLFERDPMWILLPLAALALVIWHLRKPPTKSIQKKEEPIP